MEFFLRIICILVWAGTVVEIIQSKCGSLVDILIVLLRRIHEVIVLRRSGHLSRWRYLLLDTWPAALLALLQRHIHYLKWRVLLNRRIGQIGYLLCLLIASSRMIHNLFFSFYSIWRWSLAALLLLLLLRYLLVLLHYFSYGCMIWFILILNGILKYSLAIDGVLGLWGCLIRYLQQLLLVLIWVLWFVAISMVLKSIFQSNCWFKWSHWILICKAARSTFPVIEGFIQLVVLLFSLPFLLARAIQSVLSSLSGLAWGI